MREISSPQPMVEQIPEVKPIRAEPPGRVDLSATAATPLRAMSAMAEAPAIGMLAEFAYAPGRRNRIPYEELPALEGIPQWRMDFGPKDPGKVGEWARHLLEDGVLGLDTEATGLGPGTEAVEIGLIDSAGTTIFEARVRPTIPVDPAAASIHHITDQDLAAAPGFDQVGPELFRMMAAHARDNRVFVAAYSLPYDPQVLADSAKAAGVLIPEDLEVIWVDVMSAHQTLSLGPKGKKLVEAAALAGVEVLPNAHSAIADSRMTVGVLKAMAEDRFGSPESLARLQPKWDELALSVSIRDLGGLLGSRAILQVSGNARVRMGLPSSLELREESSESMEGRMRDVLGSRLTERMIRGFTVHVPAAEVAQKLKGFHPPRPVQEHFGELAKAVELRSRQLEWLDRLEQKIHQSMADGHSPEETLALAGLTVTRRRTWSDVEFVDPAGGGWGRHLSRGWMPSREGATLLQDVQRAIHLARTESLGGIQGRLDGLRQDVTRAQISNPPVPELNVHLQVEQPEKQLHPYKHFLALVEAAMSTGGADAPANAIPEGEATVRWDAEDTGWIEVELHGPGFEGNDLLLHNHGRLPLTLGHMKELVEGEIRDCIDDQWANLPLASDYRRIAEAVESVFPSTAIPEVIDQIRDTTAQYLRRLADEVERL